MAQLDVLSVGDAATDVFIRLSDAHVRVWEDDDGQWMDLPFGGKVPFDFAVTVEAGGNAANAAVGFSRLGLSTAIAAHVGNDQIGRNMEAALTTRASTPTSCGSTPGNRATATSCCGSAMTARSWSATSSTTTTGPT